MCIVFRKQLAFAQRCSPIESKRTSSTNADGLGNLNLIIGFEKNNVCFI